MTRFGAALAACVIGWATAAVSGAPSLSLVKTGTGSQTSDSIPLGTSTYSIDLVLDTDGNPISGLELYLQTNPAGALTYGSTPVVALSPFASADIAGSPATGATLQDTGGRLALFKSTAGDYAAFGPTPIVTYQLDTLSLGEGTYTITPISSELSNSLGDAITTFATPGSFSLTVVPEPASIMVLGLGAGTLLLRRRREA